MKILYVTTVGFTMGFFKSLIAELIHEGHTVDIACSAAETVPALYTELGCSVFPLSCSRSPLKTGNLKAVREIRKIASDGHYDIVHCHTPIAAACTRLACRKLRKNGLRVIYTAHGFHFFKGAPLKNWLIYYPVEKFCARFTDVLVTINQEDYDRAKTKFKAGRIEYVPGVGVDIERYRNTAIDRDAKRKELGVSPDDRLILSVGELNENKNHVSVILALGLLPEAERARTVYAVAGVGDSEPLRAQTAKANGVRLLLLGYRKDCHELYKAADLYIHPSYREGLPVAVIEALASGLPVTGADTRGIRDLVTEAGGEVFPAGDIEKIAAILSKDCPKPNSDMSRYSVAEVNRRMKDIYQI